MTTGEQISSGEGATGRIHRGRVIRYAGQNLSDATAAIKLLLAP